MKKIEDIIADIIDESYMPGITDEARAGILKRLNVAFAEEMNAWYGYIITKDFLVGGERSEIEDFYEDAAKDEYEDHGMWLLERMNQLGGSPDMTLSLKDVDGAAKHKYIMPEFTDGKVPVKESLETNIRNEDGAIETYTDLEEYSRTVGDMATNRKVKEILSDEQEHRTRLMEFLDDLHYNL